MKRVYWGIVQTLVLVLLMSVPDMIDGLVYVRWVFSR